MITVKVKKLSHFDPNFSLPVYESEGAAGLDVRASFPEDQTSLILAPGMRVLIPTGLSVEIPAGYEIQVRPRSGLSYKTSLMVLNAPGTIDSDYRGEIKIILGNMGPQDVEVKHGDRIAQLVLAAVPKLVWAELEDSVQLSLTSRGESGFGSTGVSV